MKSHALLALVVCLFGAAARADIILSHPQSPTGGLINSSWVPPDGTDADRYAWESFTLAGAATITEIQWQGDGNGNGLGFEIIINPSMTLPDPIGVLARYIVPGNAGKTPAGIVGGTQRYNYHYVLPTPLQLAGGTGYVINIEGTGGWSASYGTGGNGSHVDFIVGLAMFLLGPGDPAFTLIGTPACAGPAITTHPTPVAACGPGSGSAAFSVAASGTGPLTYRWRKGTVPMNTTTNPSAATAVLSLTNISAADAGSYDCVVTNSCGTATANPAVLTVNSPPSISPQPVSTTACLSGAAVLSIGAAGSGTLGYRWQVETSPGVWADVLDGALPSSGGAIIASGAATAQLHLACTVAPGAAPASFRCTVTNTCGGVPSNPATLSFIPCACSVADIAGIGGLPPPDGLLTGDDFNAFIAAFAAGDALADIVSIGGQPPPDGLVTGDDFNAFIAAFAAGCP